MAEMKECRAPGNFHMVPIEEFWKNDKTSDGLYNYCKSCYSEINKRWEAKNKDRRREQHAAWTAANPLAQKELNYQRWYGFNYQTYLDMQAKQQNRCAGPCNRDRSELHRDMTLIFENDVFVGLLCMGCHRKYKQNKITIDWNNDNQKEAIE